MPPVLGVTRRRLVTILHVPASVRRVVAAKRDAGSLAAGARERPGSGARERRSQPHRDHQITGRLTKRGRVVLVVNGREATMAVAELVCLLKLVETRMRGAELATAKELGARDEIFRVPSEMQRVLKPYLHEGATAYRQIRGEGYALDESIVVDAVDIEGLSKHDEKRVRDLAAAIAKLEKSRRRRA